MYEMETRCARCAHFPNFLSVPLPGIKVNDLKEWTWLDDLDGSKLLDTSDGLTRFDDSDGFIGLDDSNGLI